MADLLDTASSWLDGMFKAHASAAITYSRGTNTVSLSATIGRSQWELLDQSGATVRAESRDYVIDAGDLVLAGVASLPQRGDRITEASGLVCEVLAPGSQPVWQYADAYQRRIRVHTKQVQA